ncbi:P1 family peptidase [Nonomuraea angiospora]|uniref:P1 family peptidase n=1 Tax=Nonomuraea angiospora TaxID=46172 RepID=UPI0033DDD582
MRAGPSNSLMDVAGLRVGHAQRAGGGYRTGTTVVLAPPSGAVAGVDVRGAAPGTRETELLDPRNLVSRVHAVVLTGGSAYGLSAACGVVERLADAGIGYPVAGGVVPIVPAAVIFDLGRGGTFRAVPDATFGTSAYDAAIPDAAIPDGAVPSVGVPAQGTVTPDGGLVALPPSVAGVPWGRRGTGSPDGVNPSTGASSQRTATPDGGVGAGGGVPFTVVTSDGEVGAGGESLDAWVSGPVGNGSVGAGTGARAGGLAGGVGTASVVLPGGATVAALVVANPVGSVLDPRDGTLAGARYGLPGEFDHLQPPLQAEIDAWHPQNAPSFNTTIGVVATDLTLTKAQCGKLAAVAHDGLARAIRPAHTMTDGDTIFGLATCAGPEPDHDTLQEVLAAGADVFSRAIAHAVLAATGHEDAPAYLDVFPSAQRKRA